MYKGKGYTCIATFPYNPKNQKKKKITVGINAITQKDIMLYTVGAL